MCATAEKAGSPRHDLRVHRALRRIIHAIDLHSRHLSAEHQITAPQLDCLLAIAENQPVTASVVARSVHLSPSTVVGILDRLEAKGLAYRERGGKDRRLVWLSLTEKGKRLAASAPSPLQKALAEAMRELPESGEGRALREALERIVDLMEIGHFNAGPVVEPERLFSSDTKPVEDAKAGEEAGH